MRTRPERIEHIRKVVKAANEDESLKNYYTIKKWRGKSPLYRKIIQIDADYLMFRIENSRTEIQQLAYMRKRSLPSDFFSDPESLLTQQAQEELLKEMFTSKGKDLLEDLELRKQEDACIITYDGYIVNGNRRTAALKYLGERYIDCVVLPEDTTPRDIYQLEQQLQIAVDYRAEYHWINELRNIRRGREDTRLGFSEKEIATNLRLDLKELRVKERMLNLVDSFLIWKKIPGQYDYPKLDDALEIFRLLEKAVKKYAKDSVRQELLQNLVFHLIEEKPSEGRLYKHVSDLIRNFEKVASKMQTSPTDEPKSEEPTGTEGTEIPDQEDDVLGELIDGTEPLRTAFENPENASKVANDLIEVIADINAENKEKQNAEAVYDAVSNALRELQGLTIDDYTTKISSIQSKLTQLIDSAQRLLDESKAFENQ